MWHFGDLSLCHQSDRAMKFGIMRKEQEHDSPLRCKTKDRLWIKESVSIPEDQGVSRLPSVKIK
jgi:hypothetical protein